MAWRRSYAQKMTRHDDARSVLRAIYNTEMKRINPDLQSQHPHHPVSIPSRITRQVQPSGISAKSSTAPRQVFPGTELRLIYELVSSQIL